MGRLSISFLLLGLVASPVVALDSNDGLALEMDAECTADPEACGLSALQVVGKKISAEAATESFVQAEAEAALAEEAEAEYQQLVAAEEAAEAQSEALRQLLSPRNRYNPAKAGGRRTPLVATQYDGLADEREHEITADESGLTHVFAVGDWGATLPGHYTAANKRGPGKKCPNNCEYEQGIDNQAQLLVANVMKSRAATSNPQYVLNVGDNLYWSGVQQDCDGTVATAMTSGVFANVWKSVYGNLANKPWLSALGNHDYGGWQFNHGWPQQIGYSFVDHNWVMPARYYSKTMTHPGFSVEYFVIDSNSYDAKSPDDDPEHNICGKLHNPEGASCAAGGGPTSIDDCKTWFWESYYKQRHWLKGQLARSKADWQIVITHFPCGTDAGFYRHLHIVYGLDLLVTGHRHQQELWKTSALLGGMTCFVTGGGGGITSERPPHGKDSDQYGFFDMTMSKSKIKLELISLSGNVIKESMVYPKRHR